jgi:hypothetical protein
MRLRISTLLSITLIGALTACGTGTQPSSSAANNLTIPANQSATSRDSRVKRNDVS